MAQEFRKVIKGDGVYLHADDLARVILNVSDELAVDTNLTKNERAVGSYVAERIALACVGGNLNGVTITVGEINFGA